MTQSEMRANMLAATREAERILEREGGFSITCGDGYDGYGWYAYITEYPDEGSVKLDAPPLPRDHVRTRLSPVLDPTKRRC